MTVYQHNSTTNQPMPSVLPGSIFYLLFRRGTLIDEALHVSATALATSAREINVESECKCHDRKGDST